MSLTAAEAAELLGISHLTFMAGVRRGTYPGPRRDGRWAERDIEPLMRRRARQPQSMAQALERLPNQSAFTQADVLDLVGTGPSADFEAAFIKPWPIDQTTLLQQLQAYGQRRHWPDAFDEPMLTGDAVARQLGLSPASLSRLVAMNRLPAPAVPGRPGRPTLWAQSAIEPLAARRGAGPAAQLYPRPDTTTPLPLMAQVLASVSRPMALLRRLERMTQRRPTLESRERWAVEDIAELMLVEPVTVRGWIRKGLLPSTEAEWGAADVEVLAQHQFAKGADIVLRGDPLVRSLAFAAVAGIPLSTLTRWTQSGQLRPDVVRGRWSWWSVDRLRAALTGTPEPAARFVKVDQPLVVLPAPILPEPTLEPTPETPTLEVLTEPVPTAVHELRQARRPPSAVIRLDDLLQRVRQLAAKPWQVSEMPRNTGRLQAMVFEARDLQLELIEAGAAPADSPADQRLVELFRMLRQLTLEQVNVHGGFIEGLRLVEMRGWRRLREIAWRDTLRQDVIDRRVPPAEIWPDFEREIVWAVARRSIDTIQRLVYDYLRSGPLSGEQMQALAADVRSVASVFESGRQFAELRRWLPKPTQEKPEEEPEVESAVSTEAEVCRGAMRGRRLILYGGSRSLDEDAQRLQDFFGFATAKAYQDYPTALAAAAAALRPGDVVLFLKNFSSHTAFYRMTDAAKVRGADFVLLSRGYRNLAKICQAFQNSGVMGRPASTGGRLAELQVIDLPSIGPIKVEWAGALDDPTVFDLIQLAIDADRQLWLWHADGWQVWTPDPQQTTAPDQWMEGDGIAPSPEREAMTLSQLREAALVSTKQPLP